jgi:mycothiol synthase
VIDRAPAGLAARPARFDDLEPVVALFEAYDREVVGDVEPRREFFRWIWALPHVDLDRDAVVVHDPAGAPVGFGQATRDPEAGGPFQGLGVVHPDHRGLGLGDWLLGSMDTVRSTLAPTEVLRNAVPAADAAAAGLLEARGYRQVRTSWDMTRALDGTWPNPQLEPGVTLRAFEVGGDEHLLHEIANEAFRDHWEHREQSFGSFAAAMYEADDWEPALASIAEVDGEPAGHLVGLDFAGMGYVASIGVLRPFRGRGIARALLARAFSQLAARGHHIVELTVDAENPTGAVRLYEGMGMTVRRETHLYDSDPPS